MSPKRVEEMSIFKNELEKRLFLSLQEGLEISENPFKAIEEKLNLKSDEILALYSSFVERGLVRRFGAVFEPSKLGYQSLLCAAKKSNLDEIKNKVSHIREITHCYTRNFEYNLWFTFTAKRSEFNARLDAIRHIFGSDILELPAIRKFKTQVIFNLGIQAVPPASCPCPSKAIIEFNSADISMANSLYNVNPSIDMFRDDSALIQKLNLWKSCGALKRIGLIPYHTQIGYKANTMCVWKVEADKVDYIGRELSKRPDVTHCYERKTAEGKFHYNLFAMMHSGTFDSIKEELDQINNFLDLSDGKVLATVQELKKSSFRPF